jgi:hypothetical protein
MNTMFFRAGFYTPFGQMSGREASCASGMLNAASFVMSF